LIPVFALGRAQELLLILDEYWQAHPELHTVPVFYASKFASKALRVYQTFVNMMNLHIRTLMDVANPFKLNFIKVRLGVVIGILSFSTAPIRACLPTSLFSSLSDSPRAPLLGQNMLRTDFDTVGPCVVLASPGFMQSGVSRHLFERWCDDDRNGVVIAGYTVEGACVVAASAPPQRRRACRDGVSTKAT
jgi:cleavage and polyadenylation specificity factor subunit 3